MGYECYIRDDITGQFYKFDYFKGDPGKDFNFNDLTDAQKSEIKAEITSAQLASITPQIGNNGNWFINGQDTGTPAKYTLEDMVGDAAIQKTARNNMGMWNTLVSGLSWSSGSVTVPNHNYYRMFAILAGSVILLCFRVGNSFIRGGIMLPHNTSSYMITYQFAATISEDTWTIVNANSLPHMYSGSHSSVSTITINTIIGIL